MSAVSRVDEDGWNKLDNSFNAVFQTFQRRMNGIVSTNSIQTQQQLLHEAQQDADEAHQVIAQMEQEIRHYPYKLRNSSQKTCSVYANDLDRLTQQMKRYELSISRGELAGQSHAERVGRMRPEVASRYTDERQQLMEGQHYVQHSGESITRTQQLLIETQEVGAATHAQLEKQREQFQNQINTVHETDDLLTKSKKTLQRMHRRLVTNKILQGAIILVQMGACGLIVYLKYYK